MTTRKWAVTDEQIATYKDREQELYDRFRRGVVDSTDVLDGLQRLLENTELFCSPEEQLAHIRTWNDQFLGGYFTDADFEKLSAPPDWPAGRLSAVVLVPYLATVHGTFTALWKATASQHRDQWCWDGYQKEASIRLLEGITHEPGLCWEVIDFGANWDKTNGTAPVDVRTPADSPHAGILALQPTFPSGSSGWTARRFRTSGDLATR